MSESNIQRRAQLALSALGLRLWRNNVAKAWVGKLFKPTHPMNVYLNEGDIVLRAARPLSAGLCVGSGDLIGIKTITVTPDMVGKKIGLFVSAEAKENGIVSAEQKNFMSVINQMGGIAGVFRSEEDAVKIFGRSNYP